MVTQMRNDSHNRAAAFMEIGFVSRKATFLCIQVSGVFLWRSKFNGCHPGEQLT